MICDVCGCQGDHAVYASSYGAISFAYCLDCMEKQLEPYDAVVAYIACAGHFPTDINEAYQQDVRRLLAHWGKTEESFIGDVERFISEIDDMNETQPEE